MYLNEHYKWKERIFIITNKSIYVAKIKLLGRKVVRETKISEISGIVYSNKSSEVILLVEKGQDYRLKISNYIFFNILKKSRQF